MATTNDGLQAAFGPIERPPFTTSGTVGTTPTKVLDGFSGESTSVRLIRIKNTHASQSLAVGFVPTGGTAPAITASGAATDGLLIGPGEVEVLPVQGSLDIYLVGSDALTSYNITVK